MRALTRHVPLDWFSVQDGHRRISIHTHWHHIRVTLYDELTHQTIEKDFPFPALYTALKGVLTGGVVSSLSAEEKGPTIATGEVNSGISGISWGDRFSVGDKVLTQGGNEGKIVSLATDGNAAIQVDDPDGDWMMCDHIRNLKKLL